MSNELITRIKDMNKNDAEFKYRGWVFRWGGQYSTTIAVHACVCILACEGWSRFSYNSKFRLWYATRPDGEDICFSTTTLRWLAVHAVYDYERKIQQNTLDRTASR